MFKDKYIAGIERTLSVFIAVTVSCDAGSVASSLDIGGVA